MAQQIKASAAIHVAFDQLELRIPAFDRARAPRQRQRGFHRRDVTLERLGEVAKLAAAAAASHGQNAAWSRVLIITQNLRARRTACSISGAAETSKPTQWTSWHHQTIEGNHLNRLLLLTLRSAHSGTIPESDTFRHHPGIR